jgi:hypothetical protein
MLQVNNGMGGRSKTMRVGTEDRSRKQEQTLPNADKEAKIIHFLTRDA